MLEPDFFFNLPLNGDLNFLPGDPRRRSDMDRLPTKRGPASPGRGPDEAGRTFDYLAQVARAAEFNGFDGVLVSQFARADEPWITATALACQTRTLRFLVAFQPGQITPVYAARMSATFQRLSGNRLLWNVINGAFEAAQHAYGDFVDKGDRYKRADEFLEMVEKLWSSPSVTSHGRFFAVTNGQLREPLNLTCKPEICTVGASAEGLRLAARHADCHLLMAETPHAVGELAACLADAAGPFGRSPRFGISLGVIARESEDEAMDEARRLFRRGVDLGIPELVRRSTPSAVTYRRQTMLHRGDGEAFEDFFSSPNLWRGFAHVGIPPNVALVGSYRQVIERLVEFCRLGASRFVMTAYPHLEQTFTLGENVVAAVREEVRNVSGRRWSV